MGYKSKFNQDSKNIISHYVKVFGNRSEIFRDDFLERFTHNWQEYDNGKGTGLGDWWYDIPNISKMKESISDEQIRQMFNDINPCFYNTTAGEEFDNDRQIYRFIYGKQDMLRIDNVDKLGIKPVQLLSAAYPDMEFAVLTVDDKGRSACSHIRNGVYVAMPDTYVEMTNFETRTMCDFKVNHTVKSVDKSKLNALEKISEPMGGKMIIAPVTNNVNPKQSFTTYGKSLDQGPSTRTMDSKVYVVQANGISNEDLSKMWLKYTYTDIKYNVLKEDYDRYPGAVNFKEMCQDLDDADVRVMYEDLCKMPSPYVSNKYSASINLCEHVPNAFICEARNSFDKKPLELLSRIFPEATFDVLEIDYKNKGKCFMIQNGESIRMPDAYMTIDNYDSRDSFELSVDHTLKPVVETDRKLNAFERMVQERRNADVSAEMDDKSDDKPGIV